MSFFHVLPSNVAPTTFPNNHASAFSTPIENAYHLNGKWEMALMNMTYSGCVNTFHNDDIIIEKPFHVTERLKTSHIPIRWDIRSITIPDIINELNETLDGVVKFTLDKNRKFYTFDFYVENVVLLLSNHLQKKLKLWNDVLCAWDNGKSNYDELNHDDEKEPTDYYIVAIPLSHHKATIRLKEKNETISPDTFVQRFKERLNQYLDIEQLHNNTRFTVYKLYNDNNLVLFSKSLHHMTSFRRAGMFAKDHIRYIGHSFENNFKESWKVYVIPIDHVERETSKITIPIHLDSLSFRQQKDAVSYLNKKVNKYNISFTLFKNKLQLEINDTVTSVSFKNTLRDIFAFDQSTFSGKGIWKASDVFSLTRRIHYLYVYSNVSQFIRIGDTEAPLLAIIPFNTQLCNDRLQEKTFHEPMYVSVIQNPIHQIDICIYDDAGEMVPFTSNAVTSLRLHFRQV